jgi:HPt (histidine-containing phosphotransfer) domain-containing protein
MPVPICTPSTDGETPTGAKSYPRTEAVLAPFEHYTDLPLVDPSVLQDLGHELDSRAIACTFARDFIDVWEERLACLKAACSSQDLEDCMDATLSLKTASMMVGARRLAQLASTLEDCLRRSGSEKAGSLLAGIQACGIDTIEALRALHVLKE